LKTSSEDEVRFTRWRERLTHELRSSESKFFRTKRSTLKVPESFPNMKILRMDREEASGSLTMAEAATAYTGKGTIVLRSIGTKRKRDD
jgi:hypothetical protein